MKHTLLILCLLIASTAFGQAGGTLMEWEVIEKIENLGACKIEVVKWTNILTGKEGKGVCFSNKYRQTNNTFRHSNIIDADEIDELIAAIPVILKKVEGKSPDEHKEVYYRSKRGLQVNCYKYNKSWVVVIKVQEQNPESYAYMHRHDLELLLGFMETAKSKM